MDTVSEQDVKRLNVLIVDDEPEMGRFMKTMLTTKAPYLDISTVNSGSECIEKLDNEGQVDCILSDYQMPGMNGMELLEEIRGKGYDTPFVFITGQGNEEVAREAFKCGANDYFTKDVGFAHFTRIVNSIEQAVRQHTAGLERDAAESASYRHFRKLEALSQAVKMINQVLEIPEVMRRLVASAMTLVDGTSGAAGTYRDERMVFTEYNLEGRITPIDYSFERGYGVPGYVMQIKAPYVSNDTAGDPHVVPEIRDKLGFRNLIDVPILSRSGELLGCFEIHNKEGGAYFTEEDVSILGSLAAGAAAALENAALLENLSRASTEWEETFDAMEDPVTVLDRDFRVTKANRAACRVLGLCRDELLGTEYFDLFPIPDKEKEELSALIPLTEDVSPGTAPENDKRKESLVSNEVNIGDRFYESSIYPIREAGEFTGYVNVTKDITERKRMVDNALRSKEVLSSILDSLELGIVVVGYDRRIRQVNRAALEMMDRTSADELIGHKCHEFICPAEEGLCPVLDLGQNVDLSKRNLLDRYGNSKPVIKSVSPIRLGGEDVLLETCLDADKSNRFAHKKAA